MADGGEIAALFATLGLKVNAGQWQQGTAQIAQTQAAAARLGAASAPGLRQTQIALGQLGAGASSLSKLLGGVAPAANQAGAAAANAGQQAAHGFDAAGAAIKTYLLYLGGHLGYEKLIAANQEFEDRTISLSAILQSGLSLSFAEAKQQAAGLNQEFQRFDQSGAPAKMSEIAEFGKNVSASVFAAKGNVKDLVEITEQGIVAAKVLASGRNAGYAALEISEMLLGQVSNRMQFQKLLLAQIHMTEEQFRELDEKQRLATVKRALSSPALKDATGAFANSFSGISTTVESKLEIMARQIGEKLFGRLKESMKGFIAWLDAHGPQLEAYGRAIGEWLGGAFDTLSKAIGIVIDYGGRALKWIGQYVDGGTLLKSLLIALGVVLTVFAVQSAIAFATNPITLIILAITALVYLIEKLIDYPGGIEQAFSDAFDAVSDAAADLWAAIKKGFKIAFDAVAELPVVKQLLWALDQLTSFGMVDKKAPATEQEAIGQQQDYIKSIMPGGSWLDAIPGIGDIARARRMISGPPEFAPTLPRSGEGDAGPVALNVSVGDINVHSPNADPVAVGDQVRKVFHEELGSTIRKTMDSYG